MLRERWVQTQSLLPIKLPEDDPNIFNLYLHCLYTDKVTAGDPDITLAGEDGLSENEKKAHRLIRTYVLADKLSDIFSTNEIIDAIIDHFEIYDMAPGPLFVELVDAITTRDSPLYRLFVGLLRSRRGSQAYARDFPG